MTPSRPLSARRYYYGKSGDGIRAYTPNEWGMGGAARVGSYSTGSPILLILGCVFLLPVTVGCLVFAVAGAIAGNLIVAGVALFFAVLFGWGLVVTTSVLRDEFKARKVRAKRGLKKAWYDVSDDTARRWFEDHPGTIEITRENFPNSTYPFPGEPGHPGPHPS